MIWRLSRRRVLQLIDYFHIKSAIIIQILFFYILYLQIFFQNSDLF